MSAPACDGSWNHERGRCIRPQRKHGVGVVVGDTVLERVRHGLESDCLSSNLTGNLGHLELHWPHLQTGGNKTCCPYKVAEKNDWDGWST